MFSFLSRLFSKGPGVAELLQQGAVVIDVRTPGEFKSGHAKGSINIPLDAIGKNLKKIQGYNKPVVTCCRSGSRSGFAARQLRAAGITAVNGGPWQLVNQKIAVKR